MITGRAFAEGLRPEQIAVQRGLSGNTVYRHIAQLIGAGKVELSAVVEAAVADQVRAAIEQAGGVGALSPIKALLPEAITYNEIACVVTSIPGIGDATARRIVEHFGSVEAIFDADAEDFQGGPRISPAAIDALRSVSLERIEEELISLDDEGLTVLTWEDDEFPAALRDVSDAPAVLFVRGDLLPEDAMAVAIVGTRRPEVWAAEMAAWLAAELAQRGFTIVSGLAAGIDAAAHEGALSAGGRTLAVLGSGVRVIHPRENRELAERITSHGALLSEQSPNAPARGATLMARDRIVSGLSRAVIVVEAGERSGSLDTANKAIRQGRLLYAVPGSPGTDKLLSEGAECLEPASANLDAVAARIRAHAPPATQTSSSRSCRAFRQWRLSLAALLRAIESRR